VAASVGAARRPIPVPRVGAIVRAAGTDLYFNSWRLVPANVAWAIGLIVVIVAALAWPPALLALPALAVPVAGIHELAALIVRGEPVSFGDFSAGMRRNAWPALALGYGAAALAIVLATNVVSGLLAGGLPGWPIAVGTFLVAAWPLLADPQRAQQPAPQRLRLAVTVCLARPGRMLAFAAGIWLFLAISLIAFAAIAMVSVAVAALVATRFVVPIADALEGRTGACGVRSGGPRAASRSHRVDT
jgi:hypothetical protein